MIVLTILFLLSFAIGNNKFEGKKHCQRTKTKCLFIGLRVDEVSELNLAIGQAIDEMNNDGFLASGFFFLFVFFFWK